MAVSESDRARAVQLLLLHVEATIGQITKQWSGTMR